MPTRRTMTALMAASLLSACARTGQPPSEAPPDRAAQLYPPTGRLLQVRGRTVHAHVEGRGPAVILLHGASGNTRDFTFSLVGRLARRYRVVAFDRPGLGHSDPLHGNGESPAEQAAHLDAAAAQLGIGRSVIVSHSYGAAVAMAWALNHPARAAGVVTLAGVTMPWPGNLGGFYSFASSGLGSALLSTFAGRSTAESAARRIFAPQRPPAGYLDYFGIELALRPASLRTSARQVDGLKPRLAAMAARYPGLKTPVEIVHGTADGAVGIDIHSRALARRLPNARLTELPGIGHMPHHAAPAATLAAIDRAAARAGLRPRA
ncbi:alpha/beta fold hydrolase [Rhodovulum euryhalinum]|uniref:Pimeloyl-ACP methyl ester carboxylesterase n=1 Tax=Rhodovulum euryhalinum TaxID=35805 RepID=A0A4R2KGE2_9RHOB|nr:alpha/beta hydrolase [Rhodovulum euryhalinum]TCO69038.1 pimeloyl-ACP methyl ester carboxylesterase [Rhodovulum euryhalinum]